MKAFFFGDNQLYGVYHMANPTNEKSSGVVLCNPIGLEYMRSYWAIKQLANKLARAGYHVLRFDYSHTGNSAGSSGDATTGIWIEDIKTALKELGELSGIKQFSIIGLRFGALLAVSVSESIKLDSLILWDPVFSGSEHLSMLETLNSQALQDNMRYHKTRLVDASNCDLLGYPYPEILRNSILQQKIAEQSKPRAQRSFCVFSDRQSELDYRTKKPISSEIQINSILTEDAGDWSDLKSVNNALVVGPILNTIIENVK
jgi:alpha/beta superfamily hydrolase